MSQNRNSSDDIDPVRNHANNNEDEEVESIDESSDPEVFVYSQKRVSQRLIRFCIQSELPLTFTDSPAFQNFMTPYLQPLFRPVPSEKAMSSALRTFKRSKKDLISTLLDLKCMISLTSDIWTEPTGLEWVRVAAHWIDSEWNIQRRILGFRQVEWPRNHVQIAEAIESLVLEYGIQDNIFSVTLDDACTSNDAVITHLKLSFNPLLDGRLFYQKCGCDIVNLCAQDALQHVENELVKIRRAISFIRDSPPNRAKFKELCRLRNLRYRNFWSDIMYSWDTTFEMVTLCMPYKDAISEIWNARTFDADLDLTEADWEEVHLVMALLEAFHTANNAFSAVYLATSHTLLQHICQISSIFHENRFNGDSLQHCISTMKDKFTGYWDGIPLLGCLAMAMDPRLKEEGVEGLIQSITENFGQDVDAQHMKHKFKEALNELFGYYQGKLSDNHGDEHELNSYLSQQQNLTDPDLDVLSWWKANGHHTPVLSAMARDLLAVPVTTVASKQCFSAEARLLSEKQIMHDDPVFLEACICLKDWFDAEDRTQGQGSMTDEDPLSGDEEE